MNFSTPFNFQDNASQAAAYYRQAYPQASESLPSSRGHQMDHMQQIQNALWLADQEAISYQPMKKIKGPTRPDLTASGHQSHLMNQSLRDELMTKNNMTSLINPNYVNGANMFDQRLTPNIGQVTSREMGYGHPIQNMHQIGFNEEALLGLDQRFLQSPEASYLVHQQAAPGREWPLGLPQQQYQMNKSASMNPLEMQMNLLQGLQQQINQSQKAYEQFVMANFGQINQNQTQLKGQPTHPYQQASNLDLLRIEQEAQRVYSDMMLNNQSLLALENLPDISLENLLMQNSFMSQTDSFTNEPYQKTYKLRESEDLDEKRTADSSNSDEAVLYKEFSDNQFNFQNEAKTYKRGMAEKFTNATMNKLPNNNIKINEQNKSNEASLLQKRRFDLLEKEEKNVPAKLGQKPLINKMSPPKDRKTEKMTRLENTQTTEYQNLNFNNGVSQSALLTLNPLPVHENNLLKPENELVVPVSSTLSPPQAGARKQRTKTTFSPLIEVKPVKRERKMNRLQSMRVAMEAFCDELKKPYVIQLHLDANDPHQKAVHTRVGQLYQVDGSTIADQSKAQSKRRVIKSLWDPSSLKIEDLKGFYQQLREIFGQDVGNQEAALKILRGTGMDVNSTVDTIKRNDLYFKAILFPDLKATKLQRLNLK